jgi:hypothetical protein
MRAAWLLAMVACAHERSPQSALAEEPASAQSIVRPRPTARKKRPIPVGTILCERGTPCPPGMQCVSYESMFPTDDPLEGVDHCVPAPDLSARALTTPWDAGVLRDLDRALGADAP